MFLYIRNDNSMVFDPIDSDELEEDIKYMKDYADNFFKR